MYAPYTARVMAANPAEGIDIARKKAVVAHYKNRPLLGEGHPEDFNVICTLPGHHDNVTPVAINGEFQ